MASEYPNRPWRAAARLGAFGAFVGFVSAAVDSEGRYYAGNSFDTLMPPEPSEEDRKVAVDLSKHPPEKLFKLLWYEIVQEEKRPAERILPFREFQDFTDLDCSSRLVSLLQEAMHVHDEVTVYHHNITGTVGLFWLLREYPEEHSWAWLVAVSHERILWKVGQHISRLEVFALDDGELGCLTPSFRTVLMKAIQTWDKIHGDYTTLLWNAVAFGMLGDVTSWREVDEETDAVADGPGGPPPNQTWSENIIFGNMWVGSVQKWLQYHKAELAEAVYSEIGRMQGGPSMDTPANRGLRYVEKKHGTISSFEHLRRQHWGGWELDKGLLREFLRHVLRPGYGDAALPSVGDFGAGGGRYSEWLNETGLVQAFSFDNTFSISEITGGRVQQANLTDELRLWRTFDWVLCLELGPFVPPDLAAALLQNIRRHVHLGLVISWSGKGVDEKLAVNNLGETEFIALVEQEAQLKYDSESTRVLRRGCDVDRHAETVAVFRASAVS
eukprot:TRINITY_DN43472_c0_g1_i1.p1 TRINITY_DN43472_c0_g1~~TRINITY_DN43472_c0_g1_i1.p1  ORF type:complete len:498 (+),score=92.61 TRINITY_DN43472_c0_g1_i1:87-1580(+)